MLKIGNLLPYKTSAGPVRGGPLSGLVPARRRGRQTMGSGGGGKAIARKPDGNRQFAGGAGTRYLPQVNAFAKRKCRCPQETAFFNVFPAEAGIQ